MYLRKNTSQANVPNSTDFCPYICLCGLQCQEVTYRHPILLTHISAILVYLPKTEPTYNFYSTTFHKEHKFAELKVFTEAYIIENRLLFQVSMRRNKVIPEWDAYEGGYHLLPFFGQRNKHILILIYKRDDFSKLDSYPTKQRPYLLTGVLEGCLLWVSLLLWYLEREDGSFKYSLLSAFITTALYSLLHWQWFSRLNI